MSMRIKPVPDESAPPDVKRVFESLAASGNLSPFQRMLAHKPGILRSYNQLSGALWAEDSKLSPKLKDMAYLRVSILNGCEY
jgi:alkylhydroperoxidase family enzyme